MKRIEHSFALILRVFSFLGGMLILLITLIVSVDVISRNVLGRSITGVYEVSQVALLAATFSVLGYVQFYGKQLTVDIFSMKFRGRTRASFRILESLLGIMFFAVLVFKSIEEWVNAFKGGYLKRGLIDIPTTVPIGFIVVGAALVLIAFAFGLYNSIRRMTDGTADDYPEDPSARTSAIPNNPPSL